MALRVVDEASDPLSRADAIVVVESTKGIDQNQPQIAIEELQQQTTTRLACEWAARSGITRPAYKRRGHPYPVNARGENILSLPREGRRADGSEITPADRQIAAYRTDVVIAKGMR